MNSTLYQYLRAPMLGAVVATLAACTTQSGPTYTLHAISTPNQQAQVYRVTCGGLFEDSNSCVQVAQETCKTQAVNWIEAVDGVTGTTLKKDPRDMTFSCGKAAVAERVVQPVVQPVPQPAPQPPARQVLLQGNANFATDSAELTAVAKQNLDHFMSVNRGLQLHRLTVTGYTDSTGSEPHNLALSQARAESVAQYLRNGGLHADEFIAKGMGSADPVASNATPQGRALNRRVDVRVLAE
ncbi:OmpA family protein [Paraburkholderia sp. PREW-6R]|uniref:OmpA family protein n=1 Tax=Paraburkholderia sp. PREW-6R TaxID=3141544 RepID=UPI0031F53395